MSGNTDLIEAVRSLLHTVDWNENASDNEIMQSIDWVGLRAALESATKPSKPDENLLPHKL